MVIKHKKELVEKMKVDAEKQKKNKIAKAERGVQAEKERVKKIEKIPLAPYLKERAIPWKAAEKKQERADGKAYDAAKELTEAQAAASEARRKSDDASKTLQDFVRKVKKWEHALNG